MHLESELSTGKPKVAVVATYSAPFICAGDNCNYFHSFNVHSSERVSLVSLSLDSNLSEVFSNSFITYVFPANELSSTSIPSSPHGFSCAFLKKRDMSPAFAAMLRSSFIWIANENLVRVQFRLFRWLDVNAAREFACRLEVRF